MICIAAFVVLGLALLAVPVIRLFNRQLARQIVKLFRQSVYCFTRHVTLRACDSSFKDDVKSLLLKRVVLSHPSWVKPLSGLIEAGSLLIIVLTVWSVLVGARSLVALYVYGTCDIEQPAACSLNKSAACTIDSKPVDFWHKPGEWIVKWFNDFGEAIVAIPARMQHWDAMKYALPDPPYYNKFQQGKPVALYIFDPGCIVCKRTFLKHRADGFFEHYNVTALPYAVSDDNKPKFANSDIVVRYLLATTKIKPATMDVHPPLWRMLERMFTAKDIDGVDYQTAFNLGYDRVKAAAILQSWLSDFGYSSNQIKAIAELVDSAEMNAMVAQTADKVKNQIKTKKIPTIIRDGKRYDGASDGV